MYIECCSCDADDSCLSLPGLLRHTLSAVSVPPLLDICSSSQETSPAFQLLWHIVLCLRGILVKLVICVVPGHWKIKILNLNKKISFFCFFMFLYPIQGGKNIGSPYLTNKSWFFGKSDVPGQQNKSYIGVMASKNLIFLMFWLSFVYL